MTTFLFMATRFHSNFSLAPHLAQGGSERLNKKNAMKNLKKWKKEMEALRPDCTVDFMREDMANLSPDCIRAVYRYKKQNPFFSEGPESLDCFCLVEKRAFRIG